mgnify:CR=1 FL=1
MINWDNVNKAIKNIIELAVPIFIANLSIVLTGTRYIYGWTYICRSLSGGFYWYNSC